MRSRETFRRSLLILVAAMLLIGAHAWAAEDRLPANRTYLAFVQGLEDNPLGCSVACLVFNADGTLVAGEEEDLGEWMIDDAMSVSGRQRVISFRITVQNDETPTPVELQLDGLCWLDSLGDRNTLTCSAHGEGDGQFINFGLTARPLGGGTSAAALSRCQVQADTFNADLGVN